MWELALPHSLHSSYVGLLRPQSYQINELALTIVKNFKLNIIIFAV